MKKMKKILAFVLAMAMVLGMTMTVFAENEGDEENNDPAPASTTVATVIGVEDETPAPTVKAYQIIKYNETGKYEPVIESTIDVDKEGNLTPSAENAAKLSKKLSQLGEPVTFTKQDNGNYTSDELNAAGTWLIVVTGSGKWLYNPAILSIRQTENGLMPIDLNLNTNWEGTVYLKKSEPKITKEAKSEGAKTVQYGDILQFEIIADIPSYTGELEDITYKVSDTLTGLKLVVDAKNTVDITFNVDEDAEEGVKAAVENLTKIAENAIENGKSSFVIDFSENAADLQKLPVNTKMVVKYNAEVTTDAKLTVDETTNSAELEYSTNNDNETQKKEVTTTHYTFGFDTSFSGNILEKTSEFIKIDKDGTVEVSENNGVTVKKALGDAWFQLHIGDENGPVFAGPGSKEGENGAYYVTDAEGRLEITGLDGDVEYYLVEIKAPTGYSVVDTPVKVKVTPAYNETTGILESYTVKVDGNMSAYNYSEKTTTVGSADKPLNPYGFKNTKLTELPSTGGIGTTIFTIGGCAIMIIAAGLFFATRRKSEK